MATERLKWLKLSTPPAPNVPKSARAGRAPCPNCGWPVPRKKKICPHCEQPLTGESSLDVLGELGVELAPRIIEIESAPEHWFDEKALDAPALYCLRLQAEQLYVTTGFDRLICLDDVCIDHYQHQLETALRALRDMRGRALLADEVGLGKTIEAGIVMKELIERGLVNSVLILTPASLTWQWHEEMQLKFYEAFDVLEKRQQLPADLGEDPCRWIISLSRAKSVRWSERLLAREYDLLIVDEAHKLKNHRTQVYRFVNQIRKRYVLMLTATPVHNDLMELYNLITILRPGQLGTRRAFRRNFVDSTYRGPYKVVQHSQARETRRLLRQSPGEKTQGKTRAFSALTTLNLNAKGEKALGEINDLRAQGYRIAYLDARYIEVSGPASLEARKERYLDNFFCRLEQPRSRTTPRNPAILRGLLREVMIRNRRRSVGVRFPPRRAAVYALNLTPPERELYDGVTTYIRQQLRQQAQETVQGERRSSGALRMTLMTLQKQLCSSPQAVARSLRKLIERQNDPKLMDYYVLALEILQGRKTDATLNLLAQYPDKFLIFTDYVPTMQALKETLDQAGHETVTFYGGLSSLEKAETVRAFRRSARVMVSTQSGSEGHNLQFCHQMINYDLPWNPMRIEQRVGRLHRLGQKESVTIFNLSANDTIEAYILDLLANKIRMFELVIGELDLILGEMDSGGSFENRLEKAWASSYSETELLQMMAELEAVLDRARASHERICAISGELSDLIDAYDDKDVR